MKNILSQKTRLKFCNVTFLKWITSNQIMYILNTVRGKSAQVENGHRVHGQLVKYMRSASLLSEKTTYTHI